jgi:hypothetical protein
MGRPGRLKVGSLTSIGFDQLFDILIDRNPACSCGQEPGIRGRSFAASLYSGPDRTD